MELGRYPRHCVTDGAVMLNISCPSPNEIIADVLWVERYCPAEIEMPGIGIVTLPEHVANQKCSAVILDQRLAVSQAHAADVSV